MDLKQQAAKAAAKLIKPGTAVGLGAGSTIGFLVDCLQAHAPNAIELYTSSYSTELLLQKAGFRVNDISQTSAIDTYFDGCDQVDQQLNALKSGGGIHTREKLLASMATDFVLLVDEPKFVTEFNTKFPLVLEVLPEASGYIIDLLAQTIPGIRTEVRKSVNSDGAVITRNGNLLVDCFFKTWPGLENLNSTCNNITGVIAHSLFFQLADAVIIGTATGVRTITRP